MDEAKKLPSDCGSGSSGRWCWPSSPRWSCGAGARSASPSTPLRRTAVSLLPTGFLGGLVAAATGAGGGFVYVPVFDLLRDFSFLRMNFHQVVATAYVVQVFGLTMGAAGWIAHLYGRRGVADEHGIPGNDIGTIVFTTLCAAVPTILVVQALVPLADRTLPTAFMIFALALGVALLIFTWAFRRVEATRSRPERFRSLHAAADRGGGRLRHRLLFRRDRENVVMFLDFPQIPGLCRGAGRGPVDGRHRGRRLARQHRPAGWCGRSRWPPRRARFWAASSPTGSPPSSARSG